MWDIYLYTHTYNGILLSHRKEWNNPFCSKIDGPRDYHIKWNKSEKDQYHMISLTGGILKNDTNELIYKTEIDSQHTKKKRKPYGYQRNGGGR